MIVVTRNGQRTVITGWRAWLISAFALLGTVFVLAVVAFALFGAALTIGVIALLTIPAVLIVALLASMFGRRA